MTPKSLLPNNVLYRLLDDLWFLDVDALLGGEGSEVVVSPWKCLESLPAQARARFHHAATAVPSMPVATQGGAQPPKRSYQEVNGPVPTGPPIDDEGLAQQTCGEEEGEVVTMAKAVPPSRCEGGGHTGERGLVVYR